MEGILRFNLPEENNQFELACKGDRIYGDLHDFLEDFRKDLKHGFINKKFNDLDELAEHVIEKLSEITSIIEE